MHSTSTVLIITALAASSLATPTHYQRPRNVDASVELEARKRHGGIGHFLGSVVGAILKRSLEEDLYERSLGNLEERDAELEARRGGGKGKGGGIHSHHVEAAASVIGAIAPAAVTLAQQPRDVGVDLEARKNWKGQKIRYFGTAGNVASRSVHASGRNVQARDMFDELADRDFEVDELD